MRSYLFFLFYGMMVVPALNVSAKQALARDTAAWSAYFQEAGVDGTFVLLDASTGEYSIYNSKRARTRFLPASTFKIMNTLIGLQNKTVSGIDEVFKWDGIKRDYEDWNRDLSLREAFRFSAVWVYQELAGRTGRDVIEKWIEKCNYGNGKTGPEIKSFWLDGDVAISAMEQVEFIRLLYTESLPFDKPVQRQVKEIMLVDTISGKELHAKTGWAGRIEKQIGWYVGYVNDNNHCWIFALNIDINKDKDSALRTLISRKILDREGIYPRIQE